MIWKYSLVLFLWLSPVCAGAAEFAYIGQIRLLQAKDYDSGYGVNFGYGGFGLVGSIDYRRHRDAEVTALYLGIRSGVQAEVGLGSEGLSLRTGLAFPIVPRLSRLPASLYGLVSFEHFFKDSGLSSGQAGLQLMFYD